MNLYTAIIELRKNDLTHRVAVTIQSLSQDAASDNTLELVQDYLEDGWKVEDTYLVDETRICVHA